jgi:hypothetical protein
MLQRATRGAGDQTKSFAIACFLVITARNVALSRRLRTFPDVMLR